MDVPHPSALLDFIPASSLVLIDDRLAFEEAVDEFETQAVSFRQDQVTEGRLPDDSPLPYVTRTEISESLDRLGAIDLGMASIDVEPFPSIGNSFEPGPRFGGQVHPLIGHISARLTAHETCVIVSRQAARLSEIWQSEGGGSALVERLPEALVAGDVFFLQEALSEGWTLRPPQGDVIHLLTNSEIFGWARPRPRHRRAVEQPRLNLAMPTSRPGTSWFTLTMALGVFRVLFRGPWTALLANTCWSNMRAVPRSMSPCIRRTG